MDESEELRDAINADELDQIIVEAADLANMAMMIADTAIQEQKRARRNDGD